MLAYRLARAKKFLCCFCSKFSNFGTFFTAACFIPKTSVKIVWHEPNYMPTSSATYLIEIRQLSKIIFFTASMFSWVVDVLKRPGRALSLISSRPSLNRLLYHKWICILIIVEMPNANIICSLSNSGLMIIQNYFLHCFNVFIDCWRHWHFLGLL